MEILGYKLEDVFRDYGAVIGSAAPAVAAYIAMIIAQYFKEHSRAKVALMIAAGLLILASIAVNAGYQRQAITAKAAEVARRAAVRDGIGDFIKSGNEVMAQCLAQSPEPPIPKANDWATRAEAFILANLGASYVVRFEDGTGILGVNPGVAVDRPHQDLWFWVYRRAFRLEEFSRELPP
jgi:hypothetical protein